MGSFARTAGGLAAAALVGAGVAAMPAAAEARQVTDVPCTANRTALLTAAITTANNAGSGTIRLASSCTYSLTAVASSGTRGPNGLPIITGDITIVGGRSTHIARTGGPEFRIFQVGLGGGLHLQSLFVEGGDAGLNPGGGILISRGHAVLTSVTVSGNTADNGAGIANDSGTLVLQYTLVSSNQTRPNGGGGGGIYSDGRLDIATSRITGNTAGTRGGGVYNEQGSYATITQSTLDANTAGTSGGGLYNGVGGTAGLTRVLVTRNSAPSGGGIDDNAAPGRVVLSGSLVAGNTGGNCAPPGAIAGCTG